MTQNTRNTSTAIQGETQNSTRNNVTALNCPCKARRVPPLLPHAPVKEKNYLMMHEFCLRKVLETSRGEKKCKGWLACRFFKNKSASVNPNHVQNDPVSHLPFQLLLLITVAILNAVKSRIQTFLNIFFDISMVKEIVQHFWKFAYLLTAPFLSKSYYDIYINGLRVLYQFKLKKKSISMQQNQRYHLFYQCRTPCIAFWLRLWGDEASRCTFAGSWKTLFKWGACNTMPLKTCDRLHKPTAVSSTWRQLLQLHGFFLA